MSMNKMYNRSFASAYACKVVPKNELGKYFNVVVTPIWNLFPLLPNLVPFILSAGLLIGIFFLLYEIVPISIVNSSDGQYVDFTRTLLFSLLIYYAVSMLIVAFLQNEGCEELRETARQYLKHQK